MKLLYETLEDLLCPSSQGMNGTEIFSDKAKNIIENYMLQTVEKDIGNNKLNKLINYINKNLQDPKLKKVLEKAHSLVRSHTLGMPLMDDILTVEAKAGAATLLGAHKYLDENKYDIEKTWNKIKGVIIDNSLDFDL